MGISQKVFNYLSQLISSPETELKYNNNFELLIAVILSAQCTDKRVNIITEKLFAKYKTPQDIYNLGEEGLQEEIKSCNFFRNKAKNIIKCCEHLINDFGGQVPTTFEDLVSLSGVGRKTANVVLAVAYNEPTIPVDTHVFRVSNRIGLVEAANVIECEKQLQKLYPKKDWKDLHHYLILFGRYHCTAINPKCAECGLKPICKYYNNKEGK